MRHVKTLFAAALLSLSATSEAANRHRFALPGGRLGDALVALGRQAGISIGVSDPAIADSVVPPVRGTFTVEQALRRMLRGSGARHIVIDSETIRIVRQPSRPPPRPPRRESRRLALPPPLSAPQTGDEEEIIVTASKRALGIGSYAGPVTVIDGSDPVFQHGIRGSDAIAARLPGLTSTHLGAGRNKLFIRGIADSSFAGPTQATVGQYFGETRINYNAPDPDLRLVDLDRVELLPGPQGTLYGAGSLGGIIRIVPNAPLVDRTEAIASVGASHVAHGAPGIDAATVLNLPLAEGRLGLRLVGYGTREGGYIDDRLRGLEDVNRIDIVGGRAAIRAVPGDGWTIDLSAVGQRVLGEDAQFADRDGPRLSRRSAVRQDYSDDYFLGSLVTKKEWGALQSVTALGLVRQTVRERYDATRGNVPPTVFDQVNRVTLMSLESRLSRQEPDGAGWLLGLSLVDNRSEQSLATGPPTAPHPIPGVENSVTEGTVYGEWAMRLAPGVTASAGGRFTYSRLYGAALDVTPQQASAIATVQGRRTVATFLPSATVAARAAPDLLFFLRYQEGFRPGGLAIVRGFDGRPIGNILMRFRNDNVAALEVGVRRGRPGTGRFDAALSLAYTRWTDVQADVVDVGGRQATANIGNGRIYALDLSFGWRPLPGLSLEAAALLNDGLLTEATDVTILGRVDKRL